MKRICRPLMVLLSLSALGACNDPLDPGPTPVGPVVVSVGNERVLNDGTRVLEPSAPTLRAPADDDIEEVDSETGLTLPR